MATSLKHFLNNRMSNPMSPVASAVHYYVMDKQRQKQRISALPKRRRRRNNPLEKAYRLFGEKPGPRYTQTQEHRNHVAQRNKKKCVCPKRKK